LIHFAVFHNFDKKIEMKKLLFCFFVFVFCRVAISQEVEPFRYRAIVRNPAGKVLAAENISLKFSILKDSITGEAVYSEQDKVKTSKNGLVSLVIGEGGDKTSDFNTIDWSSESYFLKIELDASGGSSYTDIGTFQLLRIPYELNAIASKKSPTPLTEEGLFITRKYIGQFIDYRHTGPETYGGPNIIWIKTSMEKTYGKISAYGKKCDFSVGDNLYLKRSYYSPGGVSGYWVYQVENDSSVFYRCTNFQHDKKVLIETWF
jgi:hypothetical protein